MRFTSGLRRSQDAEQVRAAQQNAQAKAKAAHAKAKKAEAAAEAAAAEAAAAEAEAAHLPAHQAALDLQLRVEPRAAEAVAHCLEKQLSVKEALIHLASEACEQLDEELPAVHGDDEVADAAASITGVYFAAFVEVARSQPNADMKQCMGELADSELGRETIGLLRESKIPVLGGDTRRMGDACIIDMDKLFRAVLQGGHYVVHAPPQSGKACVGTVVDVVDKLASWGTLHLMAAPLHAVKQAVTTKTPAVLAMFGISTFRAENKSWLSNMDQWLEQIGSGECVPVFHWNALGLVETILDKEELTEVTLVVDEPDEFITNVLGTVDAAAAGDADEAAVRVPAREHTKREQQLRRILQHKKVRCIISTTATPLPWYRFMQVEQMPLAGVLSPAPEALACIGYRGSDMIQPLLEAGAPVYIPPKPRAPRRRAFASASQWKVAREQFVVDEREYAFQASNHYGVDSREARLLIADFNKREQALMLLSLGSRVNTAGGFKSQVEKVLDLAPAAFVFVFGCKGLERYTRSDAGEQVCTRCPPGGDALSNALQAAREEGASSIVLAQGMVFRSISLGAAMTHLGLFVSDDIHLANLSQLVGRGNGVGFAQQGQVTALMRQADLHNVHTLPEFEAEVGRVMVDGRDFMSCEELSIEKYSGLLNMVRPLCKKRVLKDLPVVQALLSEERARKQRAVAIANCAYEAAELEAVKIEPIDIVRQGTREAEHLLGFMTCVCGDVNAERSLKQLAAYFDVSAEHETGLTQLNRKRHVERKGHAIWRLTLSGVKMACDLGWQPPESDEGADPTGAANTQQLAASASVPGCSSTESVCNEDDFKV